MLLSRSFFSFSGSFLLRQHGALSPDSNEPRSYVFDRNFARGT
jgi:hypothetical protein